MTDQARTPTTEELAKALRLHAYDLVNGGTNAGELRRDLNTAAAALLASEQREQALRKALTRIQTERHYAWRDSRTFGVWLDGVINDALAAAVAPADSKEAPTRLGAGIKGEEGFIDELSDLAPSPLTPHGRDCVRTILRAFAAHVRAQEQALTAERDALREALTKIEKLNTRREDASVDQATLDAALAFRAAVRIARAALSALHAPPAPDVEKKEMP